MRTHRTVRCRKWNSLETQGTDTKRQPRHMGHFRAQDFASSLGPKSPHIVTFSVGPSCLIDASTLPAEFSGSTIQETRERDRRERPEDPGISSEWSENISFKRLFSSLNYLQFFMIASTELAFIYWQFHMNICNAYLLNTYYNHIIYPELSHSILTKIWSCFCITDGST